MVELNDDAIREAWGWLPHGEHGGGKPLYIEYDYADVTDYHRMAALAGLRWAIDYLQLRAYGLGNLERWRKLKAFLGMDLP